MTLPEKPSLGGPTKPANTDRAPTPEENRRRSVLIVDDSQINRVVLRQYLKGTPYQIDEAENGAVAVEKVKARGYDFIIMDLLMPEMDGFEAMRAIRTLEDSRKRGRAGIIITLTAWPLKEAELESLSCGADAYLTKPIGKAKLLEMLGSRSACADRG